MSSKPPINKLKAKRILRISVIKLLLALPPDQVLRVLFRLDNWLYFLQGKIAIAYGGGMHTKHHHTRYHDFFRDRISAGERVLDIGCGIGAVAYDVAEKAGAKVVGIDINPKNIAHAQKHHAHPYIQYITGDALQAIPNEAFDVVILSNVLEHLHQRAEFLRDLQRAAHPSRMLIRVPLFERDWRVPLKKELCVEWRLDPTHEIEYTLESFYDETSAANLKITYKEVRWGEIWAELVPKKNNE